eukprot:CAMPEP_0194381658 /NCGR_PEP_ID=MMETSP0174-20130528/54729_1 /TAXON_ID=216777 /ORGANISM="Proboscia alata, Strain PI-D3" /LENGTH=207 /DNA_ID=CAMNT_0039166199 /DNA_START=110 /DNA_END=733 /DNA_ORIENTATION=+
MVFMANVESFRLGDQNDNDCPIIETVSPFDVDAYASAPWYIHKQAVTSYSPIEWNYCTKASYTVRKRPTFPWRYTIDVNNYAEDVDGNVFGGPLCASVGGWRRNANSSKLAVAPCFLPKLFDGPYWVVHYDESEGYALISGGQPTKDTGNGCTTGTRTNNSGLWIFLRTPQRDDEKVAMVEQLAINAGFDTSVLNDVIHQDCSYDEE